MRPGTRELLTGRRGRTALLAAIIAIGVIARVAVAISMGDTVPEGKDELSYSLLAARLASGHGMTFPDYWYPFTAPDAPTAHWSFLYTGLLAAVYGLVGVHPLVVRLITAVAGGMLLPAAVYALGRRLLPERDEVAWLAAAIAAAYAYFILFAAMVMTETFYIIAVLWSLERAIAVQQALEARRPLRAGLGLSFGLSLAISTLLRQSILPWVAVLFIYLLWSSLRERRFPAGARLVALAGLTLLLSIMPLTIRNYRAYGEFLLLNSNAGYALYAAQHPMHGTSFRAYEAAPLPDDLNPRPRNEAEWDRALMRRGLEQIADQPVRYILLSLSRLADYFLFWPTPDSTTLSNAGRLASFTLFLPMMLYGLWVSRASWRRYRLLYAFMAFTSLMHVLTWAMVRYRLPVDAVLLIFAALGLAAVRERLGARASGPAALPQR